MPSISDDVEYNIRAFKNFLPTFYFIGTAKLIDSTMHYVVDSDVQLVCKYLKALKIDQQEPGSQHGINKLLTSKYDL